MTYKHRWIKNSTISLFGTEWSISVVAKAYSQKPISQQQQDSYFRFQNEMQEMSNIISETLITYINNNYETFAINQAAVKRVDNVSDLPMFVKPKTLLFLQDGTLLVLFDCIWDDHGIAVQLLPDIQVGGQDLFL